MNENNSVKKGVLILVPTPLQDDLPLEQKARERLLDACTNNKESTVIAVEEMKNGRRRWISWGLPREMIDQFILCNEHCADKASEDLLKELKSGKTVFLLSDCGLPAFCDPGQKLVDLCHKSQIQVTATPFPNSIALTVALSGYPHSTFIFEGFLPAEREARDQACERIIKEKRMSVIMDTPYRLKALLSSLKSSMGKVRKREIFLALDLNAENEHLLRGDIESIEKTLQEFKREFILIVSPL